MVDVGLRSFLQGHRDADQGRVFENIVYLQLLYDGWDVSVGRRSGTDTPEVSVPRRRAWLCALR